MPRSHTHRALPACHRGRAMALATLTLAAGCAGAHRPTDPTPRTDRSVITEAQLRGGSYASAYDAVAALRSNWLRPRGRDSFIRPTPVWVYVNANRAGGVEALRTIVPASVAYIRFYDGIAASGRWGDGHGQGVIFVSTMPRGTSAVVPFE